MSIVARRALIKKQGNVLFTVLLINTINTGTMLTWLPNISLVKGFIQLMFTSHMNACIIIIIYYAITFLAADMQ